MGRAHDRPDDEAHETHGPPQSSTHGRLRGFFGIVSTRCAGVKPGIYLAPIRCATHVTYRVLFVDIAAKVPSTVHLAVAPCFRYILYGASSSEKERGWIF